MQVEPTNELKPFIKHYLFLESRGPDLKKLRLFPDGNTGIVWTFAVNLQAFLPGLNSKLFPNSFVYGQITAFRDLYLAEPTSIIIAVFQPYGLHRLLGIPAHTIKGDVIGMEDLFPVKGKALHEQLSELTCLEGKWNILNDFFLVLSAKRNIPDATLIQASTSFILKTKGASSITQLVRYTGYSERHLERIFNESVGISPKRFGDIVKLHRFLSLLKTKSKQNKITDFCYEAGYADQSHLIKAFKKYTGITPTEYLNETMRLAINFMEIKSDGHPMSGLYNLQKNA